MRNITQTPLVAGASGTIQGLTITGDCLLAITPRTGELRGTTMHGVIYQIGLAFSIQPDIFVVRTDSTNSLAHLEVREKIIIAREDIDGRVLWESEREDG